MQETRLQKHFCWCHKVTFEKCWGSIRHLAKFETAGFAQQFQNLLKLLYCSNNKSHIALTFLIFCDICLLSDAFIGWYCFYCICYFDAVSCFSLFSHFSQSLYPYFPFRKRVAAMRTLRFCLLCFRPRTIVQFLISFHHQSIWHGSNSVTSSTLVFL